MKKIDYLNAVEFIALNDAPADTIDLSEREAKEQIRGLVTVALLSELSKVTTRKISKDVYDVRKEFLKEYLK